MELGFLCKRSSNASNINTYVGEDGKIHFTNSAGADSVLNFSSGITLKAQSFAVNVARYQSKSVTCNGGNILYVAVSSYNYYYNGSQSFTATVSVSISGNRATITNNCDGGNTDSTIVGNLLYAG